MHFINGHSEDIPSSEYRRLLNRALKDPSFRTFQSGTIIRDSAWNFITVDKSMDGIPDTHDVVLEEEDKPIVIPTGAPIPAKPDIPAPQFTAAPVLTGEELKALYAKSGLTQEEFSKKIGYSRQSLNIALSEGKISKQFSDAVKEAFK